MAVTAGIGQASELEQSWVVEASAGTGKTTALVQRIAEVVAAGTPVEKVVAVTFTHAAAGNMKLRVRQELELRRAGEPDAEVRDRLAIAARTLDRAFIGTIHAFCAQLLRRRPVEARVDPVFQELAQPDALRVFARVFRRWIERKLAAPSPALSRALARLAWRTDRNEGEPLDELRKAAWNLTEWRDFDAPWTQRPFDREARLRELVEIADQVRQVRPVVEFVQRARRLDLDRIESEVLRLPWDLKWAKGSGLEKLKLAIEEFRKPADADLAAALREELWEVVGLYQEEKRRAGQLDFMDLLLSARDLLRHPGARTGLQQLYDRIFVDEFQDTDPLQAEILLLLAAADPAESDWRKATPAAGKLFVVGDPKQSIYRFRRADARLFYRVCTDLKSAGVGVRELKASTRSTDAIQAFVNAAFETRIDNYLALEGGVPACATQPSIIALPMPEPYGTRNISNVKIDACSPNAVAAFIEWMCKESGWTVRTRSNPAERVKIRPEHVCILFRRFTNFGTDLTQEYVRCLEARGIPHLLVGSKSFHRREEVGTLRTTLRAIEWPDDELSVFAVLRGSLVAVPDDTLLRWKNEFGHFGYVNPPDEEKLAAAPAEFAPIFDALTMLRELHRRRNYRPIADTINELLETTRAHAGFAFRKGGERVLANVFRLTDLARSFEVSGAATSFRAFVEYLENELEASDQSEAPILEQEGGGVQLMTVHKAKGLEFPVVILADLTAKLTGPQGADRYTDPDRHLCAQRLLWCAPWELLDAAEEEARADEEEALRVAYVAATRARDLLIVAAIGEREQEGSWLSPLHDALYPPKERWRGGEQAPGCPQFGDSTVLNRPPDYPEECSVCPGLHYPRAGTHSVVWFDPRVLRLQTSNTEGVENEQVLKGRPEREEAGLRQYQEWKDARAARIAEASVPRQKVVLAERFSAADEARSIAVETVTLEAAAGRPSGRKFGRLVHDILQRAERAGDVEPLAAIWGRRHGAGEAERAEAAAAARGAVEYLERLVPADAVRQREVPVMVRLADGTVVDGRIDFAWLAGGQWTVIDYKTDRREKRRVAQVQAYALALQKATGLAVRGIVLEV